MQYVYQGRSGIRKSFGGSFFNGWFEVNYSSFGTSLAALSKDTGHRPLGFLQQKVCD